MLLLHLFKAAVFSDRYSHFCYEPRLGGNKFYNVKGFPAIILPEENPLIEGKYGCAKSRIVDVPQGNNYIFVGWGCVGERGSLLYTHSSRGM